MPLAHKLYPLAVLAVAVWLLALALPRLNASLQALRPIAYLDSLSPKQKITLEQIGVVRPELQKALQIHATAQYYEALSAYDRHYAAFATGAQEQRSALLQESAQLLRDSLAAACANPYAWLALAQVEQQLPGAEKAVLALVGQSILTGPAEANLYLERLNMALKNYPAADRDARDLIARQLRLAWQYRRNDTLKLVTQYHRESVLSAALSFAPDS